MSMRALEKIDKFYPILGITFVLLSILIIITVRGIFSAVIVINDLDEEVIGSIPHIDEVKLDSALSFITAKDINPLDLKE